MTKNNVGSTDISEGSSGRILIVDDEPHQYAGFVTALKRQGFSVDMATSAADGLEMAIDGKCALAVVDIRLPGGRGIVPPDEGGYALLRALRRHTCTASLPIIMTSLYVPPRFASPACMQDGRTLFVAKPVTVEHLIAEIERMLGDEDSEEAVFTLDEPSVPTAARKRSKDVVG